MVNTSLPTGVSGGSSGHLGAHNTIHAEINRMSRDTGWRLPTLQNGWTVGTSGFVRCRRINDFVIWQFAYLDGSGASGPAITFTGNPPAGAPAVHRGLSPYRNSRYLFRTSDGEDIQIIFSHTQVGLSPGVALTGKTDLFEIVAAANTDADWPSTLPPAQ